MKVQVFVPTTESDFYECHFTTESIPPVGTKIVLTEHSGLDLEVERIVYAQHDNALVLQLWLKDVGPTEIDDWLRSMRPGVE